MLGPYYWWLLASVHPCSILASVGHSMLTWPQTVAIRLSHLPSHATCGHAMPHLVTSPPPACLRCRATFTLSARGVYGVRAQYQEYTGGWASVRGEVANVTVQEESVPVAANSILAGQLRLLAALPSILT